MRKLALLVVIVVAAVAFWRWHGRGEDAPAAKDATATVAKDAALPVSAVLAVRPEAKGAASAPVATMGKPGTQASPDIAQFRARRDYASLYARVKDVRTPEALYLQAALYARCGSDHDAALTAAQRASNRDKFVAEVSTQGNRATEQRIAAYDRLATNACAGLDFGTLDAAKLDRMIAEAASAGDPRAQAWQLADRIEGMKVDEQGRRFTSDASMPAGAMNDIQRLLATGDPDVVMDLSGVLASTMGNGFVQIDGAAVDPRGMYAAMQLYACDVGASCGAESPTMLSMCAYIGNCDAGNLYDYMYYYELSPNSSQVTDLYRQRLRQMYETGNFSGLGFVAAPVGRSSTYHFGTTRP
ncbi:MAG: hypothetical protein JSR18_08520 [Proteobacteria bacterium]|nr:hypothetical protein [Pseudomonadota bacterium]